MGNRITSKTLFLSTMIYIIVIVTLRENNLLHNFSMYVMFLWTTVIFLFLLLVYISLPLIILVLFAYFLLFVSVVLQFGFCSLLLLALGMLWLAVAVGAADDNKCQYLDVF